MRARKRGRERERERQTQSGNTHMLEQLIPAIPLQSHCSVAETSSHSPSAHSPILLPKTEWPILQEMTRSDGVHQTACASEAEPSCTSSSSRSGRLPGHRWHTGHPCPSAERRRAWHGAVRTCPGQSGGQLALLSSCHVYTRSTHAPANPATPHPTPHGETQGHYHNKPRQQGPLLN